MIACGTAHVLHQRKIRRTGKPGMAVLLSAPGITLPKWKAKEIEATVPDCVVNIIRNGNDALALLRKVRSGYKPKKLEFTLVGIDKAKLGSELYFSGVWRKLLNKPKEDEVGVYEYAWHCPGCGKPILVKLDDDDDKSEEMVPAPWDTFAEDAPPSEQDLQEARSQKKLLPNGLPMDWKVKWKRKANIPKFCNNVVSLLGQDATDEGREKYDAERECGDRLWRPALQARGECRNRPRVNISQILKRLNGYFSLYICDEAHMCKSENSGRGDAFAQMVKSAKRTLMLTGTLTNGKSTSIKELLWRTDPRSLLDAGIDYNTGSIEWATRFGKIEQIIKEEAGDEGVVTRRKKKAVSTHEAPGIAPHLTATFLLHKSAFLELPDIGLPLVELKEFPVFLDMDDEHGREYSSFHTRLYDACKVASQTGNSIGVWAKFNPSTLMYASRPELGMSVNLGSQTFTAPPLGDEMTLHRLERWLVDTVKSELAEGRRCVIYNQFTGRYGMNERVSDILSRQGIRCQILDEPNTEKRTERLAEYEEAEIPVIICQMKLVEVGLDLLYWPTIIYFQLSNEVSTVRQSSRRAWRIGQNREARVYYPIYNGSQKMKQFLHIMAARGHALMVEGRLDKSELAQYSRDSQSSLARDLASCFAGADVAKAWTDLAAKELEGIEMVAEANFKDVLVQRMKELADETVRLCGIDPESWRASREMQAQQLPAINSQLADSQTTTEHDDDLMVSSLFSVITSTHGLQAAQPKVEGEDQIASDEEVRIMTFAQMVAESSSKRSKKKPVNENQLMWDLG